MQTFRQFFESTGKKFRVISVEYDYEYVPDTTTEEHIRRYLVDSVSSAFIHAKNLTTATVEVIDSNTHLKNAPKGIVYVKCYDDICIILVEERSMIYIIDPDRSLPGDAYTIGPDYNFDVSKEGELWDIVLEDDMRIRGAKEIHSFLGTDEVRHIRYNTAATKGVDPDLGFNDLLDVL